MKVNGRIPVGFRGMVGKVGRFFRPLCRSYHTRRPFGSGFFCLPTPTGGGGWCATLQPKFPSAGKSMDRKNGSSGGLWRRTGNGQPQFSLVATTNRG